ncbi:MAG: response regulator [Candidatus Cloacimonadales bacterium]
MKKLIAIIDDEPDILKLVSINLEKANYETSCFERVEPFRKFLATQLPDLIVLDLMLPDADGFEVCKELKSDSRTKNIPIIMLTAKGDVTDRVLGLEFGADDYMVKPFSPRELAARVKAILRRSVPAAKAASQLIKIGKSLQIDLQKHKVFVDEQELNLTTTEFKILKLLSSRLGWVYSRNQILDYLWGNDKIVVDRTVDVHIRNLRHKLGNCKDLVKNIRGVGYKIEQDQQ